MKIAICSCYNPDKIYNYLHAFELSGVDLTIVDENCDINEFNGLVLPGGCDVNPKLYHQEINGSVDIDDHLDSLQLQVLDQFVKANKPVLGICRGHQLLNVYFGGTLIQDLSEKGIHHCLPGENHDMFHDIVTTSDNYLNQLYGNQFRVNSYHHQAIDKLGNNLVVDAMSLNNVIEAMHHKKLPIISVQFHPERLSYDLRKDDKAVDGSKLIKYFIYLCK